MSLNKRLSVSWYTPYDSPNIPHVTEVVTMFGGEPAIKVYDTNESLIRMWQEIEYLYGFIDSSIASGKLIL